MGERLSNDERREVGLTYDDRPALSERPMQPVMVRLPPDLYAEVKAVARREDRTLAQTIRRAICLYLEGATDE